MKDTNVYEYELLSEGVLNLTTNQVIPADPKNKDWQLYLQSNVTPRPIKPNEYCSWDGSSWIEDSETKEAEEDAQAIRDIDQELIADADSLLTCLINHGILTGYEPEIQNLMAKKAIKDAIKNKEK